MFKKKSSNIIIRILFTIYLLFLIYVLLLKGNLDFSVLKNTDFHAPFRAVQNYTVKPFHTIRLFLNSYRSTGSMNSLLNLLGNVLILVPYGIFIPMLSKSEKTFCLTFLSGSCLILLIELTQLITLWGVLDIDDYILNISGVLLGWLIILPFRSSFRKK